MFFVSYFQGSFSVSYICCPVQASSLHRGHSIKFAVAGTDLGNKANVAASCAFGELSLLTGREWEHTQRHRQGSLRSCLSPGKLLPSMHRLKKSILKFNFNSGKSLNFFSPNLISSNFILFGQVRSSEGDVSSHQLWLICVMHVCFSCSFFFVFLFFYGGLLTDFNNLLGAKVTEACASSSVFQSVISKDGRSAVEGE